MSRITAFISVAMALSIARTAAQDPSPELRELRELRVILEQQSKRLDSLQEQLSELRASVEKEANEKSVPEPLPAANPKPVSAENPKPSSAAPPQPLSTEGKVPGELGKEVPRAEAAPSSTRHIVVKGETLTSIARHYNISVSDLQRSNKIEDDRKLQIGQALTIPLPKLPEAQPQKSP